MSKIRMYGGARHPGKATQKMRHCPQTNLTLTPVAEGCRLFLQTLNNPTQLREYIQTLDKMREVHLPSMRRYGDVLGQNPFSDLPPVEA